MRFWRSCAEDRRGCGRRSQAVCSWYAIAAIKRLKQNVGLLELSMEIFEQMLYKISVGLSRFLSVVTAIAEMTTDRDGRLRPLD